MDVPDDLVGLLEKVLPAGGEASRGGARLVWELSTTDLVATDRNAKVMVDAGVVWARATAGRVRDPILRHAVIPAAGAGWF